MANVPISAFTVPANTVGIGATGYSLTGSASASFMDLAGTWNTSGTPTAIKLNITDTASNAASLLMDLQVGGASKVRVDKTGAIVNTLNTYGTSNFTLRGGASQNFGINLQSITAYFQTNSAVGVGITVSGSAGSVGVSNNGSFGFHTTVPGADASDTILTRRGAANLRLGAADTAGSAIAVNSVASNQLTLASAHGLTNGAAVQVTFTGGGAVPAGTAVNTTYYARSISAAVLELYGTYDQAITTASTTGRVSVTTAGTTAFINRATPFQTLSVQSFTGTDIPGQPFVITGSQGTGTGAGGSLIFQVAPAGSSGTAQNALATALTINSARNLIVAGNIFNTDGVSGIFPNSAGSFYIDVPGSFIMRNNAASFAEMMRVGPGGSLTLGPSGTQAVLIPDAANTLALRNGTAAQRFNVYNTTDGTNSELLASYWAGNTAYILTLGTGIGPARNLAIGTAGNSATLTFWTSGAERWRVDGSGHFIAVVDNTYDIGASGTSRPRNGYFGGNLVVGGSLGLQIGTGTAPIYWAGRSQISSPANGNIQFTNSTQNDFGLLQFGGTSSSFPAIKRSTTFLQARLADDSAFAGFASANMQAATAYTVATLPGTPGTGMIARVTDATAPTIGTTVVGGGAAYALVNYNGANWTVIGV